MAFVIVVLLLFVVSASLSVNGDSQSHCLQKLPQNGIWSDTPPHWQIKGCPKARHLVNDSIKSCLKGRDIYFLGPSTVRQYAFHTGEMLGGQTIDRLTQKVLCPSISLDYSVDKGCQQDFEFTKIHFLNLQFLDGVDYTKRGGFPFVLDDKGRTGRFNAPEKHTVRKISDGTGHYPNPQKLGTLVQNPRYIHELGGPDACIFMDTKECLHRFFKDSKPNDVLIFNAGLVYGTWAPSTTINIMAWLNASAIEFTKNLQSTFKGKHIYRASLSQVRQRLERRGPYIKEMDSFLYNLWENNSNKNHGLFQQPLNWKLIDQWSINEGRFNLYNDFIHFPGPLAMATLYQIYSDLCPAEKQ